VVLEVAPLRARRDDIGLLVEHFLSRLNVRYRFAVRGMTPAGLRLWERYPWQGNVRELEAILEQAMILRSGEWITPTDLELPVRQGSNSGEDPSADQEECN
jgi:DNA-binding NtrC family response regulator